MANIQIKDVTKSYGALEVIHGVSLDIEEGEFVILVGPSGCGKSTLLRMIAGLESITGGDVVVDDVIINALPPRHRDIAMVFQSYALYPHMTVRKNMAFSLKLAGAGRAEIDEKVERAAKILDLEPLLDRKPAQLSGGQRQRVAMGRAIVRSPKLFLFDEPLSNLDAKLRVQMRAEIKELHQRLQTTTIYVTHDQVEAMTMADRIVVMNGGNIEQIGTPLELYERPRSLFVAAFIGSPGMNLVKGTLDEKGEFIAESGGKLRLVGHCPKVAQPTEVVLGLRPEFIEIGSKSFSLGNSQVRIVEPTGSETLLSVNWEGDKLLVLDRSRRSHTIGEDCHLTINPDDMRFFDQNTGLAMG